MFERLMGAIDNEIVHRIFKIAVATPDQIKQRQQAVTNASQIETPRIMQGPEPEPGSQGMIHNSNPIIQSKKPGRNDPCYCGSEKKYKKCHGK
jgi:preprotein translocase subunit SecA